MSNQFRSEFLLHGGDYNPEQWPRPVWEEDMQLMRKAHWNVATIGVFSWSQLEPCEGEFNFGWMDDLFSKLEANGMKAVLATPSAAQPAWMSNKYPEVLRVDPSGVRRKHGNRVNYCWTSPIYRHKVKKIATKLAERYGSHPALALWHISNEYGGECHCDLCRDAFREWLKREFNHDLDKLNAAFWTTFWGHNYTSWDEIEIPGNPVGETSIHGLTLCWKRFVTDQIVDFYLEESAPIRELSPNVPVTTNLMGFYGGLNPWKLVPHVDIVAWDSYPGFVDHPLGARDWQKVAMTHDLNRSLGGGKPFLLIECTPSSSNWYHRMTLKPPGMHMMESMQAIAHGSEGAMVFQWRQSRGSQEKFHGAVVGHGCKGTSRVFGEVATVGKQLEELHRLAGTELQAEAAIIYDWEVAWALEGSVGPLQGDKRYHKTCLDCYAALSRLGITTDIVSATSDLSKYKLVIAPMLYSVSPETVENIRTYVRKGGTLLATYLTAYADQYDLIFEDGLLGPFRDLFGIEVEEMDVMHDIERGEIAATGASDFGLHGTYSTETFSEIIRPRGARTLAQFNDRFFAGSPAITSNEFGDGLAVYVGARTEQRLLNDLISAMVRASGVSQLPGSPLPEGISVVERGRTTFVMNTTFEPKELAIPAYAGSLAPFEVRVIEGAVPVEAKGGERETARV